MKFIILFQGRTGSSYLTESINSYPGIVMLPEILGGEAQKATPKHVALQIKKLNKVFRKDNTGFKAKLADVLDHKALTAYIKDNDIKIIYMVRKNLIKLAISVINGRRLFKETGLWNLENAQDRLPPFRVDLPELDHVLTVRERQEEELREFVAGLPTTIEVEYEDLLHNEKQTLKKLYTFLGVPFVHTKGTTYKNTDDDISKAILNYEEVVSRYKGTKYEEMVRI